MSIELLLLDRDGVINLKNPVGYVNQLSDFKVYEDFFELMQFIELRKIKSAIITNQQGLAKRNLKYIDFFQIHGWLAEVCIERNIQPPHLFYCSHLENSCICRKPKTGMLEAALVTFGIRPSSSLLIGDEISDILPGKALGVVTVHLKRTEPYSCECTADFHVKNLIEVFDLIENQI